MIKLENITKIYNNNGTLTTGLHNVSIEFNKNEIVAITGESGSGKSTLLNVLTKMDLFEEGEYYYKGNETSYFDINDLDNFRKNKVGFIFQNYNILDSYTVLENVMLPFKIKGMDSKTATKKAMELIKKVGLEKRYKNRGTQLSGGEKQRCVIARALASDCDILACDEPTGNLDSKTSKEILDLIREVAQDKLVLIVTHNFEQVKDMVTRKIKIHDGNVVEDIVYKKSEKDEDEVLELDYVPMKKKIKCNLAVKNLLFTPKRTILSVFVLLFISLFALSMYQSIYSAQVNMNYYNDFVYLGGDKVIVYDINNKELDMEKITPFSIKYTINSFYDTTLVSTESDNYNYYNFGYEKYPKNFKLDGGRMPEKDYECIALISKKHEDDYVLSDFRLRNRVYAHSFEIVGYQVRDDITEPLITNCDLFEKIVKLNAIFGNAFFMIEFKYYEKIETLLKIDLSLEKSVLKLASGYTIDHFVSIMPPKNLLSYDINIDFSNIEIVQGESEYNYLHLGKDFFDQLDEKVYEVCLYVKNPQSTIKEIDKLGYSAIQVNKFFNVSKMQHIILNIGSYILMIISSIVVIAIYFITYVIMAKIYSSKKKDFTIFRTLGISKNDMKDIVVYEMMTQTVFVSTFTYLVIYIISLMYTKGIFQIFKTITLFTTILYFTIMLLLGYCIARRFNKKLFKFSVNATLKDGESK